MDVTAINKGMDLYSSHSAEKLQNLTMSAAESKEDAKLMQACREFEAYFVTLMLKEMRKTINYSDGIIKRSQGEEIFTEMLDEETGKSIAGGNNGTGLAQTLYKQMKSSAVGISYEQYLKQIQSPEAELE